MDGIQTDVDSVFTRVRRRLSEHPSLLPFFVLILSGGFVYLGSFSVPFIFDDSLAVPANSFIRRLWPVWEAVKTPDHSPLGGRPVAAYTFALNYAWSGYRVWSCHVVNLILHLLNGLLVFELLRRTLRTYFTERFDWKTASLLSLAIALLWLIHPIQTESVTYLVQRTELLMAFFYLLTFYCFMRNVDSSRNYLWFALAWMSSALGMASKESMVTCPLLIFLYDWIFSGGFAARIFRKRGILYAGLALTWSILGVLCITGPNNISVIHEAYFGDISPSQSLMTQASVLLHYIRLSVWPHPLVIDYDWPVTRSFWESLPSGSVILILLAGTAAGIYRRSWIGFLGAWFFLILAPTSSFLPLVTEIAAERRMYLPVLTIIISGVMGGYFLCERIGHLFLWKMGLTKVMRTVLLVFVLAVSAALTINRNRDYQDPVRLYEKNIQARPNNPYVRHNLGVELFNREDFEGAIKHFRDALKLYPENAGTHAMLAKALANVGNLNEARRHYLETIRIDQAFVERELEQAQEHERAMRLNAVRERRRRAAWIYPRLIETHLALVRLFSSQNDFQSAGEHTDHAQRLSREYKDLRDRLSQIRDSGHF